MKTLILFLSLTLTSIIGKSQNNEELLKGIHLLDTAKTNTGYTAAVNHFEKIANSATENWLAQYYASFSNLIYALKGGKNEDIKDELYDKAMAFADKANKLSPNNSEVYVLKGYITFLSMAVYPQQRAMEMVPISNAFIEKAITLNQNNPRAYFIKGISEYYLPSLFGGDKELAKKTLELAKSKFDSVKVNGIEPNWGKTRCLEILNEYK